MADPWKVARSTFLAAGVGLLSAGGATGIMSHQISKICDQSGKDSVAIDGASLAIMTTATNSQTFDAAKKLEQLEDKEFGDTYARLRPLGDGSSAIAFLSTLFGIMSLSFAGAISPAAPQKRREVKQAAKNDM